MTRVLVAVDDSEESRHAAEVARRLFGAGAEYLAINVGSDPSVTAASTGWGLGAAVPMAWGAVWTVDEDAFGGTGRETAREDARDVAEAAGLAEAQPIGQIGDPADAIVQAARQHAVDVIVVGSHDRSWLSRVFSPSVSSDVVKHSDIPVLVAK